MASYKKIRIAVSNNEMVALDNLLNGIKTSKAQAELDNTKARKLLARMKKEWTRDDGSVTLKK